MRTSFHVALGLFLLSLTCDLGAACALADMAGSCCCEEMMGESTPCMDLGGDESPGAPEQTAVESGQRFSVAVLDAPRPAPAPDAAASILDHRAGRQPGAAAPPLYLSHCAFLC